MATFPTHILVIYSQLLLSSLSYDVCFDGPMDIIPGNHIDNIFVGDVLEISFDLKINSQCITTNCMIFNIGNKDEDRFPLISIDENNNLDVSFSTNSYWNDSYLINDTYLSSTMFDGNYHKMYFKFSNTDRIFIFDDNITYKNIINGIYDSSNTIYTQYPLRIVDSASNPINGSIQNLCINSSIYRPSKPPQIANQSLISQSVLLPMTPYHNGAKVEILQITETDIMNNRGYEWDIDDNGNNTGFNLKISFNDSMKWNFNEQLTSSIQLIINSNHENASIDQDLIVSFSISSNKYISTIIHTDNNNHDHPYYFSNNRIYPATNTSCSLNTGYYAIGDIESIVNTDSGQGLVKKTMGGQQQYDDGDIFQPPNHGLFNNSYPLIFTFINYPHKNQSILTLSNGKSNITQFCGYAEIIKPDDDLSVYISSGDAWERHGFSSFILNKFNIPTLSPTYSPTTITSMPSTNPSKTPTINPTINPTKYPTKNPTKYPTKNPTKHPTQNPTKNPTKNPSETPTLNPTKSPINDGAANTVNPTTAPNEEDVNSMDNDSFFDKWKVYIMIIIILLLISILIIICVKLYCHKKPSKEEKGGMELARITSESINKNNDEIWKELQQTSPRSTDTATNIISLHINEESDVFGNQNALKMWLNNINMIEHYDLFIEEGFGDQMSALSTLTDNDLQQIGIKKLAHRKAILLQVDQMNITSDITSRTNTVTMDIDIDGEININDLELPKEEEQKEQELADNITKNGLNDDDEELYRKPSTVTIGNDIDENTDSNNNDYDNNDTATTTTRIGDV